MSHNQELTPLQIKALVKWDEALERIAEALHLRGSARDDYAITGNGLGQLIGQSEYRWLAVENPWTGKRLAVMYRPGNRLCDLAEQLVGKKPANRFYGQVKCAKQHDVVCLPWGSHPASRFVS